MNRNPLLNNASIPRYDQIHPKHVIPAIKTILRENRAAIRKLLMRQNNFTWQNLVQPLSEIDERLKFAWSAIHHLNGVVNSEPLRKSYATCIPLVTKYCNEIGQNTKLYQAFEKVATSKEFSTLDSTQQKIIQDILRDFRLSGVNLNPKAKQQFKKLTEQLAKLTNSYSNNVLDATRGWSKYLTKKETAGIPDRDLAAARTAAQTKQQSGWLFTLDFPSYRAILTYADSRKIRREFYTAYVTRASDCGPNAGKWDNNKIIEKILNIRKQLAKLLGYQNYAEYSLATKMAKTTQEVLDFLYLLAKKSLPMAKKEFRELKQFAKKLDDIRKLQPWDIAYYSEKLRQQKYDISQEQLRPYFPEPQVLQGMFAVVKKLFGITIKEVKNNAAWHPEVRFFAAYDQNQTLRGQFFLDLYARENKRSGAWMDSCITRRKLKNGKIQTPVSHLICNFNRPIGDEPALLSHNDVITLFHELGHNLHHILTKVDYDQASGINGVPQDAVELPSQFMENWCWQSPALKLFAKHYQTGATLPRSLLQKMLAAKNFQAAMQMLRQLEFGIFDFRLHTEFDSKIVNQVSRITNSVNRAISVVPNVKFNRMPNCFLHLFGDGHGYAAGYYSYKWAEVLSADAFAKFEQRSIFDRKTGAEFLHSILEAGGSADPMDLFIKFRGRKPKIDALLKHSGI